MFIQSTSYDDGIDEMFRLFSIAVILGRPQNPDIALNLIRTCTVPKKKYVEPTGYFD